MGEDWVGKFKKQYDGKERVRHLLLTFKKKRGTDIIHDHLNKNKNM